MVRRAQKMSKRFRMPGKKLLLFVFLCLAVGMNLGNEPAPSEARSDNLVTCDIHKGPCAKELAGGTVNLDIDPKPVKAMKDLKFRVSVSGMKPLKAAYIDLGMPGMDMGPNRVELRRVRDNVYEGQGIIVRCPSGRRTWKATVTLPEAGKVEFLFDVIY
jgi:hypothetical protein